MNRNPPSTQLSLFPDELPTWESLSQERQQALQEVLSLLLEQMLQQHTCQPTDDPQKHTVENNHV